MIHQNFNRLKTKLIIYFSIYVCVFLSLKYFLVDNIFCTIIETNEEIATSSDSGACNVQPSTRKTLTS